MAQTRVNLASVLLDQANYSQAILLLDQAAEIYRQNNNNAAEELSKTWLNEARVFRSQGLLDDAADYCQKSLNLYLKVAGANAPGAVEHYITLAGLCIARAKLLDPDKSTRKQLLADADSYSRHAWQLCQQNKLVKDPIAGAALYQKARMEYQLGRTDDAKNDWQAALTIQRENGQKSDEAQTLNYLASLSLDDRDPDTAEQQLRQALQIQGNAQAHPEAFYITSCKLAEILHDRSKTDEASQLVQKAIDALENPRAQSLGGEAERAAYFAEFAAAFDLLVSWNLEPGNVNVDKAFEFAERGRNRTFLDQLSLVGVDLRDTLGPSGQQLRDQERTLRTKFATLQAKAQEDPANAGQLIQELSATQRKYAGTIAAIHNSSSYYRERLLQAGAANSLKTLRKQLAELNSVMLFYYAGAKQTFLLVIDPQSQETIVKSLEIPKELAGAMKVGAGPVTRASLVQLVNQYLADVRDQAGGRGLAGTVISPKGVQAADQGTALAEVLVPRRRTDGRRTPQHRWQIDEHYYCSRWRPSRASFRGTVVGTWKRWE